MKKKLKILITGGCGFIGSNLCIFLKKKNFNIYSLDNLSRKGSTYNLNILRKIGIKNFNYDISNTKKINNLPKFDLVIDCCAEAAIEVSKKEFNKVIHTNLTGTINILQKIKKDNSKIIYLSSSRVYPIEHLSKGYKLKNLKKKLKVKRMINEKNNIWGPKSIYGLTKLASEMFIEEFAYAYGIKYIINRCGVISGPLQFGKQDQGFVSLWIWKHLNKKNLSYIGYGGHGNQIRDVLHIYDLCDLIYIQIRKFNKINNKLFTLGGSKKSFTSLKDLTRICEKVTGNIVKFKRIAKTSNYDIPCYISDNKKIMKTYGWKPKKNIKNIVNDTYSWLSKNKKKLIKYF